MKSILKQAGSLLAVLAMAVCFAMLVPTSAKAAMSEHPVLTERDASGNWSPSNGTIETSWKEITNYSNETVSIYYEDVKVQEIGAGDYNVYECQWLASKKGVTPAPTQLYWVASGNQVTFSANKSYFPESSAVAATTAHTHNYVYTTITSPSEEWDGEYGYVCSCGDVKNREVIPAINTFMANRVAQIEAAKAGQDITLKMEGVNSLPKWFMEKIAAKNNVNFKLTFTYNFKTYEISIPSGTVVDLSCDWYGPEKLIQLYNGIAK